MKKDKKIIILVNYLSFFLSHRLPIAEALLAKGFEVFVGYGELRGADPKILEQKGIKVEFIPMQPASFNLFKELKTLYCIWIFFKKIKPDIVHLITIKPYLYGGIVARYIGIPCVVSAVSGMGSLFLCKFWINIRNNGFQRFFIEHNCVFTFYTFYPFFHIVL